MESSNILNVLAALAHDTRMAIYRLLAQRGAAGLAAGDIGEALSLAPATLSFHLRQLAQVGLVRSRQQSRFIYYRADGAAVKDAAAHLARLAEPCGEVVASPQAPEQASPSVPSPAAKPVIRPKPQAV
jgi:DNA-binding transcriptional ArsR family regulator